MNYFKFTARANKKLLKIMSSDEGEAKFTAQLKGEPKDTLVSLLDLKRKHIEQIERNGKYQFEIIADYLVNQLSITSTPLAEKLPRHDGVQFIEKEVKMLGVARISETLRYWIFLSQYEDQAESNDACKAAMDDLKNKVDAMLTSYAAYETCLGKKVPSGGGISGGIAQVLGADQPPSSGDGGGSVDCSGYKSDFDSAVHDLDVAINNLPFACG
jgi:hypothetical protein